MELPPVSIRLVAQWTSGSATMNATVEFAAATLDDALRMIKHATGSVPIFTDPDNPEEESYR